MPNGMRLCAQRAQETVQHLRYFVKGLISRNLVASSPRLVRPLTSPSHYALPQVTCLLACNSKPLSMLA